MQRLLETLANPGRVSPNCWGCRGRTTQGKGYAGALGQEAGIPDSDLWILRKSLNKLSRYNFGRLRSLHHAREWQAK